MNLPAQPAILSAAAPQLDDRALLDAVLHVSEAVAGARTLQELAATVRTVVAPALQAVDAAVGSLSSDRRFVLFAEGSADRVDLDRGGPIAAAIHDRLPVSVPDAGVVLPLAGRDNIVGVLTLAWPDVATQNGMHPRLLEVVVSQLAQSLDRARLYDHSRETARVLQESLLPAQLPVIPGLDIAVRYLPLDDAAEVGGDFYDVFRRGDGRTFGISIGDVSGKGVRAASTTALARHTIRAVSSRSRSPARVLAALNRAILADDTDDRYLTAAHLVATPDAGATHITMALGGQPQLLLRSADGSVRPVGEPGPAIGLFERDVSWADDTLTVANGNVLIAFTDGIGDVRNPVTGDYGDARIADALATATDDSAEDIADHLLHELMSFCGGQRRDDIALLVLRPT